MTIYPASLFLIVGLILGYLFFYNTGLSVELEPTFQAGAMFQDTSATPPTLIMINDIDTVAGRPVYLYTLLTAGDSAGPGYRILFGNKICETIDSFFEGLQPLADDRRDRIFGVVEVQGLE